MTNVIDNLKQRQLEKIITANRDNLSNIDDLLAGEEPSLLFYILADKLGYLLDSNPDKAMSDSGIKLRKHLNVIIKKIGPLFLKNPQVIENRNELLNPNQEKVEPDNGIVLPDEPVIWAPNHAFKDDTLASILAIYRHAYILFGSLPQFYNTFDGVTAWLNGVVMANRKVSESKHASIDKGIKAINAGADLLMFPEGVWNKTPNSLVLNLWPGIYRIAKATGVKVVPVAHYIRNCADGSKDNKIHTVISDPIRIDDLSEKEGLEYLRDSIATWYYLMMEKYGQSTRDAELTNFNNANEAWEKQLRDRVATADRYDTEIEYCADYRPRDIVRSEDVWKALANAKNINIHNVESIMHAKHVVNEQQENDYQRRF